MPDDSSLVKWIFAFTFGACLLFGLNDACINGQDEHMPYGGYIHVERYPEGVTNMFKCNWYIYRQDGYKNLSVNLYRITFLGESKLIIHTAKPSEHSSDTLVYETTSNHTGEETFVTDAPYFYFEIKTNWGTVSEFTVQYLSYNEPDSGKCPASSETHVNSRDFLCSDKKYCINGGLLCNEAPNCMDGSDESNCSNNVGVSVGIIFGIIIGAIVILLTTYFVIRYYQLKHPESFFRDQFDYEKQRNETSARYAAEGGSPSSGIQQIDPPPGAEVSPSIQV